MPISFSKKSKVPETLAGHLAAQPRARLVDLRSPETFCMGFIPGSYNVSDLACVAAARRTGLFQGRTVYLLAENEEQLQLCSTSGDLGQGSQIEGWFGAEAVSEWRVTKAQTGSLEAITSDTLAIRMAAWNTIVFDILEEGERRTPSHAGALRFYFKDLPLSMEGLPTGSSVCLTARTSGLASFAASLLWNFGFHRVSYLGSGCRIQFPLAS